MARVSSKHRNVQRIIYPSFDGGLNLSVPSESLARNELKEAVNVEFSPSTGAMTVRGGLRAVTGINDGVRDVCPLPEWNAVIFSTISNSKVYVMNLNNMERKTIAMPMLLSYGIQAVLFDDSYIITNGQNIYCLNGSPAGSCEQIPVHFPTPSGREFEMARFPFVRNGRVGVVSYDWIRFSAVGDYTDWEITSENAGLDDAPKKLEIGYKDGLNISAVVPLSTDLIIFKSSPGEQGTGKIYRLTGSYPNWSVLEVASGTGTFSNNTIQTVGNDIYYLSRTGLSVLSTVTEYGGIKTFQPDKKVNQMLLSQLNSSAQLWHIPEKQQLWISPSSTSNIVWVFDYAHNIWTIFEFPLPSYGPRKAPDILFCVNNTVYVFMRYTLYVLDESRTYDETSGNPIVTGRMKMGKLTTGRQILVKGAYAEHNIKDGCSGELVLGKFRMPFSGSSSRRQFIVRDWSVTPEIYLRGGGCSLSVMGLETAEV